MKVGHVVKRQQWQTRERERENNWNMKMISQPGMYMQVVRVYESEIAIEAWGSGIREILSETDEREKGMRGGMV